MVQRVHNFLCILSATSFEVVDHENSYIILYKRGIHYENKITPDCKVTDSCSDVMVVNDCDDCVMIRRTDSGIIHITTNAFISISS